jgi:hypothetical protein
MNSAIGNGYRVFMPEWEFKDLNEALMSGYSEKEIEDYINAYSTKGPMAMLRFNKWKRRA